MSNEYSKLSEYVRKQLNKSTEVRFWLFDDKITRA